MKSILTVIVPVGPMVGRTDNLFNWLKLIENKPLEVIIIVDDKKDGTRELIIDEVTKLNFENITLLSGAYGGPGLTRNEAIPLIRTKWFSFWDADDFPNINNFLEMILEAGKSGHKVAMGQFSVKDSKSQTTQFFTRESSEDWELSIAQAPGIWRFAFCREEFQQVLFPALIMGEDQVYLASLNIEKKDVYETNLIVYEYFIGMSEQLTQKASAIKDLEFCSEMLKHISNGKLMGNQRLATFMFAKQQVTQFKKGSPALALRALFLNLPKFIWGKPRTRGVVLFQILSRRKKYAYPNQIIIQGGLGNQLFQISALKYFSGDLPCQVLSEKNVNDIYPTLVKDAILDFHLSGMESIKINRSYLIKKLLNLALRVSATYAESDTAFKKSFLNTFRALIQFIYTLESSPQKLFIARGLGEDRHITTKLDGTLLVGYFQSYRYAEAVHKPIQEVVSSRFKEVDWLKKLKVENLEKKAIIVQVRLGDYLQNEKFGFLDSEYFKRTLVDANSVKDFTELWLFSDDEKLARNLLSDILGNDFKIVVPEDSVDLDVLCAMTLGKKFIISNSTFGWWGAFLSQVGMEKDSIYFPEPWFRNNPSPLNLTPPNWEGSSAVVS